MKLNIYSIHNGTGSRFYRLVPQLKYLQDNGHKAILAPHDDPLMKERILWSDVVIFQMTFSREWVEFAKKAGKKVIFDCDDLIHIVPKDHYAYSETKGIKNRIKWWNNFHKTFGKCDGFISTNKLLDKKYGWLAKKSLIFYNYIDIPHWLKEYKPNTTDKIRILWAGSTSHKTDLKPFKEIIKEITYKYPQTQFIYIGMGGIKSSDKLSQFIYGEDFWKDLPDNRESMLAVPAYVWPYTLASLQADIGLAPLEKNYFNKFKSTCKFLEYSVNKIPAVYSKWFYEQDVIQGETGLLAKNKKEWLSHISILIENEDMRKRIKNNAYNYIMKNKDIRKYLEKYEKFILSFYE